MKIKKIPRPVRHITIAAFDYSLPTWLLLAPQERPRPVIVECSHDNQENPNRERDCS